MRSASSCTAGKAKPQSKCASCGSNPVCCRSPNSCVTIPDPSDAQCNTSLGMQSPHLRLVHRSLQLRRVVPVLGIRCSRSHVAQQRAVPAVHWWLDRKRYQLDRNTCRASEPGTALQAMDKTPASYSTASPTAFAHVFKLSTPRSGQPQTASAAFKAMHHPASPSQPNHGVKFLRHPPDEVRLKWCKGRVLSHHRRPQRYCSHHRPLVACRTEQGREPWLLPRATQYRRKRAGWQGEQWECMHGIVATRSRQRMHTPEGTAGSGKFVWNRLLA